MRTVPIDLPKLGVDLLASETAIDRKAVRAADNIDIGDTGEFSTRVGHTVVQPGTGFHSMHHTDRTTLVVKNANVYAYNADTNTPHLIMELPYPELVEFTDYNGHVYFTASSGTWWLPSDEFIPRPVGSNPPDVLPNVTPATTGTLTAGKYVVGVSVVDDRDEESAMVVVGQVELTESGGIRLAGMAPELVGRWRVYITPPDGEELYLAEEFSRSFGEYVVTSQPDGAIRRTQYLAPMPGGQFIRGRNGRLYVASGDTLWFSEPLRPHLRDARHGYIKFVGQIRFIEPVEEGMFVGDDRGVWFMAGDDPTNTKMRLMHPARAVKRSSTLIAGSHFGDDVTQSDRYHALWLSTEGYVLGHPSGNITPLQPERVRIADGLEGRTRFLTRDGLRQVITLIATADNFGYGLAIDSVGELQ